MKYDQYRGLYTNGGYHPVEQLTMFKRAPQVEIGPGVHLSHRREPRPLSRTTASAQPRRGIDFYICISYTFTSVFLKLWLLYFFNFYICISKTYLFLFRNTSLDDGVRLDYLMSITLSLLSFVFLPFCACAYEVQKMISTHVIYIVHQCFSCQAPLSPRNRAFDLAIRWEKRGWGAQIGSRAQGTLSWK